MPPHEFGTVFAWIWLGCLMLAVVGYFLRLLLRKNEYSLWENCLYAPTFVVGRLRWRVGFENEPPPEISGGAVLVANHDSSIDPFLVQLAARRRVHWMVAKEFCDHFLFGRILKPFLVIPTNRSGMDTAATKRAIRLTGEGRLVGMFPEGKINQGDSELLPLRSGAALVASKSNVPLIPLHISGSPFRKTPWSPLFIAARVRISFGKAVMPENYYSDENGKEKPEVDRHEENQQSEVKLEGPDAMIFECGRQILELAGARRKTPELAAARHRNGRGKKRSKRTVTSHST